MLYALNGGVNIAAARAVDREFKYRWLKFGWREAGELRPPHSGGLRPPDPQKALRALCCSGWYLVFGAGRLCGAAAVVIFQKSDLYV